MSQSLSPFWPDAEGADDGALAASPPSSQQDVDALLDLAEEIRANLERIEFRILSATLAYYASGLVLAATLTGVVVELANGRWLFRDLPRALPATSSAVVAPLSVAAALGLFASLYLLKRYRDEARPERWALSEAVEILREVGGLLAKRQAWSAIAQARFKIRMSRFDMLLETEPGLLTPWRRTESRRRVPATVPTYRGDALAGERPASASATRPISASPPPPGVMRPHSG